MVGRRAFAVAAAVAIGWTGLAAPAGAAAAPPRDPTEFFCPADLESGFTDISGSVHENNIECVESFGIASGTSPTTFSPDANVTRGQIATFAARALALAGAPLDPADAGFTDLGGSVHTNAINALANLGVINGISETEFGPDLPATRAQVASFTARTIPFGLPESPPDAFTDDNGSVHEENINKLAAVGILGGVTPETYNPSGNVTRAADASILARTFDFVIEVGIVFPPTGGNSLAAALSGENEVPGPGDGTSGGGVQISNGNLPGLLCVLWDIDQPFASNVTAAHIHVGTADVGGPILIPLPIPEIAAGQRHFSTQCVSDVDDTLLDLVFSNPAGHYVNVHTADHPDGASRGQLTALATPLGTVLTGTEEAPGPGEADAGGQSTIDIYDDGTTICSFTVYEGAGTPMAAHIHQAAPGAPGDIVVTLPPFDPDGPVSDGCVGGLDPALVADIAANPASYYVNVHTDAFPDGAVRGQLELSHFLDAQLDGPSEAPGPGDDDGTGSAFIDVIGDGRMCVHLHVQRTDQVIAAHVHAGEEGVAGDIVVPLVEPIFGTSDACVDADPAVVDAIVEDPEGFYVNVHTNAFPAGAVRGQLADVGPTAGALRRS